MNKRSEGTTSHSTPLKFAMALGVIVGLTFALATPEKTPNHGAEAKPKQQWNFSIV